MKKKLATLVLAGLLALSSLSTAFAGTWLQDNVGWWYQNDDGTYPANGWHWIDGNNDGTAECYYFNESGYCLINTTTPDGYAVDANGAWIVNGVTQTQQVVIPAVNTQPKVVSETPASVETTTISETVAVQNSWDGKYPYVDGMVRTQPTEGHFWTVNIKSGKYHVTPNVADLLEKNTAYYPGAAEILEAYGYKRCQKNGCE